MIVHRWIERFVVGHNLCPFARREMENQTVRIVLSEATSELDLLARLREELELLDLDDAIETTVLIHPHVLEDFFEFNQFLDECERLLVLLDREGVYQIASFHPQYQFADTEPEDAENYSNRSPYPMLHILRERSVEKAVADYPDIDNVPARNLQTLESLGREQLEEMWRACFTG